jgi:5-methylcytosine-specific restriction endonuclease McrA
MASRKGLPVRRMMVITYRNAFKNGGTLECGICHKPILQKSDVSLDHILPQYRGGRDEPSNYQPTHYKCNQDKGSRFQHEVEVTTAASEGSGNSADVDKNANNPS